MQIEIRQLSYFVETVRLGKMSSAAHELGLTEQALSKSIKRLEQSLGHELFDRRPAGLVLTEFGTFFLKRARAAVDAVRFAENSVRDYGASRHRAVTLGMPAQCLVDRGGSLSPAKLARLQEDFPGTTFSFCELSIAAIRKGLLNGSLTFGIGPEMPADRFESIELGSYPLSVAVRPDSPLAQSSAITVHEVARHQIALASSDVAILSVFGPLQKEARVSPFRIDTVDPADMLIDADTVALMPEQHALRTVDPSRAKVIRLVDDQGEEKQIPLPLSWRKGMRLGASEVALVQYVVSLYGGSFDPEDYRADEG